MSKPKLPPPLNGHKDYTIYINAMQFQSRDNPSLPLPTFSVEINVTVGFLSTKNDHRLLPGLSMRDTFEVPCDQVASEEGIPTASATTIVEDMILSMFIPFELDQVEWQANHLYPDNVKSGLAIVCDEKEVAVKIVEFMCGMRNKSYNKGKKVLALRLLIEKFVSPPEQEFEECYSWYEEQMKADKDYEEKYFALISKSPALRQLEELRVLEDFRHCSICYEEMSPAASKINRMPCSHTFHEECIVKWLKNNLNCPLCRFVLPIND